MKTVLAACLFWAVPLSAHPGIGIVADSRGNIFYTDLSQVWRVAPSGQKSIAVPDVHTHELFLDASDNLFGEHLWYEGDRTKKWGHRVWKRAPDGTVTTVIPPREGFLRDYSFVRDRAGTMYWPDQSVIRKTSRDGKTSVHTRAHFNDLRWMYATPSGILYVVDRGDVLRVDPNGRVMRIAQNLSSERMYGVWTDVTGNVYVAAWKERRVFRIDGAGKVTVAAKSAFPWAPTGGMFDHEGKLWLLEATITNQVRVRRVDP